LNAEDSMSEIIKIFMNGLPPYKKSVRLTSGYRLHQVRDIIYLENFMGDAITEFSVDTIQDFIDSKS